MWEGIVLRVIQEAGERSDRSPGGLTVRKEGSKIGHFRRLGLENGGFIFPKSQNQILSLKVLKIFIKTSITGFLQEWKYHG